MFVTPYIITPGSMVLIQVLTYFSKHFVKRKSINSYGGYPLTVQGIQYAKIYSASSFQHGLNIFISLSTDLGYILMTTYAINEYAQAPAPDEIFYVHVYHQYRYCYRSKLGI